MPIKERLSLVRPGDITERKQYDIAQVAASRSVIWKGFLDTNPEMEASWMNAITGWLAGTYPEEFELDLG